MTVFHIMREEKATWSSQFVLLFVPVEVLEKAICVCIVHTHTEAYLEVRTYFSKDFQRKEVTLDCSHFFRSS